MSDGLEIKVDVNGLVRALRSTGRDLSDMREAHRDAADVVLNEWKSHVPVRSGEFRSGGFAKGLAGYGKVNVMKKGPRHAGVTEFGGSIPRHNSKHRTFVKPHASKIGQESYFLYPALDAKMTAVRDRIMAGVKKVMDDNGLSP